MSTTLYGFKSCDTVKKARKWLDDRSVAHTFFDYRVTPPQRGDLKRLVRPGRLAVGAQSQQHDIQGTARS